MVSVRREPVLNGASIVVGHDGSASADGVLAWAVELAEAMEAKVVAAYIGRLHRLKCARGCTNGSPGYATGLIAEWAGNVNTEVHPVEAEGEPRLELVRLAERLGASLIVVGRRGTGGVRALRMGSVASYLVTNSPVPIACPLRRLRLNALAGALWKQPIDAQI